MTETSAHVGTSSTAFEVLFESDEMIIINKPADVAMDGDLSASSLSSSPSTTVASWAYSHMRERGIYNVEHDQLQRQRQRKRQLKFVHQLDYATSGVLCLAYTKDMAARLAHCFEMRTTQKHYIALLRGHVPAESAAFTSLTTNTLALSTHNEEVRKAVEGAPIGIWRVSPADRPLFFPKEGKGKELEETETANDNQATPILPTYIEVNLPIGVDTTDENKFRMAVDGVGARAALTHIRVLGRGYIRGPPGTKVPATRVLLCPRTGRRHQLRVHCHAIGFPILGDTAYAAVPVSDSKRVGDTTNEEESTVEQRREEAERQPRMYLHAWRLRFPCDVARSLSESERVEEKKRRRRETLGLDSPSLSTDTFTEYIAPVSFPELSDE